MGTFSGYESSSKEYIVPLLALLLSLLHRLFLSHKTDFTTLALVFVGRP